MGLHFRPPPDADLKEQHRAQLRQLIMEQQSLDLS
jgi:hypothetical protein